MKTRVSFYRCTILLAFFSALFLGNHLLDQRDRGLVRTVYPLIDGQKDTVRYFLDRTIDFINWDLRRDGSETRILTIQWDGYLWLKRSEKLAVFCDGDMLLEIDGEPILHANTDWEYSPKETDREISSGCHRVSLRYRDDYGHSAVRFCRIESGSSKIISSRFLSPTPLSSSRIAYRRISDGLWIVAQVFIALLLGMGVYGLVPAFRSLSVEYRESLYRRGIVFFFIAGFLLRLVLAWRSGWLLLADESVVGIMGQRIASGGYFPIMYLGQDYGGPLEAYLLAPFFRIFGSSPVGLRLMPLVLSSLAILALAGAARRCFGHSAGLIAAALWAIPPVMPLVYSIMAMVGPIENVLAIALAIAFWGSVSQSSSVPLFFTGCTGFCLGLGLWINAQILFLLLPLCFLMSTPLCRMRGWRFYGVFGGSFIAGSMPLILYNIQHSFKTISSMAAGDGQGSVASNFMRDFLSEALPALLGQKVSWRLTDTLALWPGSWMPIALAAFFVVLPLIYGIRRWIQRRPDETRSELAVVFLLLAALCVGILLFSASNRDTKDPRHLFLLSPIYLLLVTWGIRTLARRMTGVAITLVAFLLLWNIQGILQASPRYYFQPIHMIAEGKYVPTSMKPVWRSLQEHRVDSVYIDYWMGANLAFECHEQIPIFSVPRNRFVPEAQKAMRSALPAYLFHINQIDEPAFGEFLTQLGWRREKVLPLILYVAERPLAVPKAQWTYTVYTGDERTINACDGALQTFWNPQILDLSVTLSWSSPVSIQRIAVVSSSMQDGKTFTVSLGNTDAMLTPPTQMSHNQAMTLSIFDVPSISASTMTLGLPTERDPDSLLIYDIFLF